MVGLELPCGCRELNSGPLYEQQVLLTTEPPLTHTLLTVPREHLVFCPHSAFHPYMPTGTDAGHKPLMLLSSQSFTHCGRMKRGQLFPRGSSTKSGTEDMTIGFWLESSCILRTYA